jgi:hypothetical protein
MLEEQPGKQRHAERLDEPVHEARDEEPCGAPADANDRCEIDLQHHRVNHQPDEDGDRDVDLASAAKLDPPQIVGQAGKQLSQADANDHAQTDPQGQIVLKDIQASDFRGFGH